MDTLAIEDFSRAIQADGSTGYASVNRGFCYLRLARHADAIADFSNAVSIFSRLIVHSPLYSDGYFFRGRALRGLGRFEDAIRDQTECIRLDPSQARAYAERGLAYMELGKPELAALDWRQATRLLPSSTIRFEQFMRARV